MLCENQVIWRNFLRPDEIERLAELERARAANKRERLNIYDRCRKRMNKAERENPRENPPQSPRSAPK